MNIEGSEGRVRKGTSNLLDMNENIKIITEFYPKPLDGIGKEINFIAEDYLEFLREKGFMLYNIDEKTKSLILSSPTKILDKFKNKWSNLLCER